MITIKKISATAANDLLQQGGLNWVLFQGDDFDAGLYEEWSAYAPTETDIKAVEAALAKLDADEALKVDHEA